MPSFPALSESQLAAFRQKAGPILAEQRGLTAGALARLGEIARDMGLADDQMQDAIRALHAGTPKPKDPAVEKFRSRLLKDLSAKKTIIGPEIEARIVAGGVQKYQLAEAVILETLAEVAVELGLRQITGNEATAHFVEMVDAAIGDKTWLNRQSWDRLRAASEKWGLTFEDADQLVEQKLDANRRSSFRGKIFGWVATYGSIGIVACVLVVLFVLMSRRNDEPVTGGPDGSPGAASGSGDTKPLPAKGPPEWWGYELAITASDARRDVEGFPAIYSQLVREQPEQRGAGYAALVQLGAKISPVSSQRTKVEEMLVGFHAREPDDKAAEELRTTLVALIPQNTTPLSTDDSLFERAFWGVGVLRQLFQASVVHPHRPAAAAAALSSALGIPIAPETKEGDFAAKSETALSLVLFQHLVRSAPHHPAGAPVLHKFLAERGRLPSAAEEREPLEASYLAALLPASVANWRDHQELITKLARSKNPLVTLRMADLLVKVSDRSLQSLLAEELVRQTGAKPRTSNPKDIARSIRQTLGAAGASSAQSQEDRWDDLKVEAEAALRATRPAATNHAELLKESVELARLATLAAALSQGEAGIPVFDELLSPKKPADPEEPMEREAFEESSKPAAKPRPLSNREKQQIEQMLATLRAYDEHPPVQRTGSLRALAQAAPNISDLSYDQAAVVAHYLLAEKSSDEQQAIGSLMPHFKAWRNLRLAMADQVEESKLASGNLHDLVNGLLSGGAFVGSESLRRALLLSVQQELGSGKGASGDASAVQKPVELLAEHYRTRARLAGVSSAELIAAESPGQVLETLVKAMTNSVSDKKFPRGAGSAEQLEVARFLGTSDVRKTVLLQRLVLRAAGERITALRPRQAEAAAVILSNLETADTKAENLLVQLYQGEVATLRLGMLYGTN